jgi:DUF4097 and DUF4098 domain-containing protein YvlB
MEREDLKMKLQGMAKIGRSGLVSAATCLSLLAAVVFIPAKFVSQAGPLPIAQEAAQGKAQSEERGGSQSEGQGRELHETYDLAPGGVVAVTNTSGFIRVSSWNENRVKVDAIKRAQRDEDPAQVEIQVVPRSERIEIRTVYLRDRGSRVSVDYEVKVPRSAVLNSLTTSSGDIAVNDPVARVTARSTSGAISVRDVTGDAILSSTSGRINAGRVGGSLNITATSGELVIGEVASSLTARCSSCNIRARGLRDDVTAQTSSGNIDLERIGGRATARATSGWVKINEVGGDVIAESYSDSVSVTNVRGLVAVRALSGPVTIRNAGEGARVEAVSGSVDIRDSKGRIDVNATSGSITLHNIEGKDIRANANSGGVLFTGRLYDGGRYEFTSFSSNVVLLLPPDSNFNLTVNSFSGSVNTEFPLTLGQGRQLGNRAPVVGVVGKGGAEVRAISHSGSVQIKKAPEAKRTPEK